MSNLAIIPGPWKNATTLYLLGIMDASFFHSVQEIVICAPPQTGKSDCVNNCIGYAMDRKPGNVLYVYPDELTAKENNKDRITPMIKDSARMQTYLIGYVMEWEVLARILWRNEYKDVDGKHILYTWPSRMPWGIEQQRYMISAVSIAEKLCPHSVKRPWPAACLVQYRILPRNQKADPRRSQYPVL